MLHQLEQRSKREFGRYTRGQMGLNSRFRGPQSYVAGASEAIRTVSTTDSRTPGGFSGTARVEKGFPKGPDLFLDCSERLVYAEPLNEHTYIVTFRVGLRALVQAFQPIPHQFRLAQILDHHLLSRYRLLSRPLHNSHLPSRPPSVYSTLSQQRAVMLQQ